MTSVAVSPDLLPVNITRMRIISLLVKLLSIYHFNHGRRPWPLMSIFDALGLLMSIVDVTKRVVIYLNDARACGKDMKAMMVEVCCASGMAQSLAELARVDDSWVRTIQTLASKEGPLHQANEILRELESKLKPQQGIRKIAKAAVWPWQKEDAIMMLRTMQRLNSVFSLALQCDHMFVSYSLAKLLDGLSLTKSSASYRGLLETMFRLFSGVWRCYTRLTKVHKTCHTLAKGSITYKIESRPASRCS